MLISSNLVYRPQMKKQQQEVAVIFNIHEVISCLLLVILVLVIPVLNSIFAASYHTIKYAWSIDPNPKW